jgi:hypothetical protein
MASAAAYPFQLGDFHRDVTCAQPEAQRWFDRGMAWAFGFHHEEAILARGHYVIKRRFQFKRAQIYIQSQLFAGTFGYILALNDIMAPG